MDILLWRKTNNLEKYLHLYGQMYFVHIHTYMNSVYRNAFRTLICAFHLP